MTQALIAFSRFMQTLGWWLIPAVVVGTGFVLFRFHKTPAGKEIIDRVVLMIAGLRIALPQGRHDAVRSHARGLTRCRSRFRPIDRLDRRCTDDEPDLQGRPLLPRAGPGGQGPQRDPRSAAGSFTPMSSPSSPPARKPESCPRA